MLYLTTKYHSSNNSSLLCKVSSSFKIMVRQSVGYCLARGVFYTTLLGVSLLFMWLVYGPSDEVRLQDTHQRKLRNITTTALQFTTTHCLTDEVIRKWSGHYKLKQGVDLPKNFTIETDDERKELFQKIFTEKIWLRHGKPTDEEYKDVQSSGHASTYERTEKARKILAAVIDKVKKQLGKDVIRLLDIACGDMVWMNRFLRTRSDIVYVGMDIVPDIIEKHKKRYVNMTNWSFQVHDIVKSRIDERFDMIFSRHMTMNLQTLETVKILNHFSSAGSYLLLSDYPNIDVNHEIQLWRRHRFTAQNLCLYPFKLTPPMCIANEASGTWLSLFKLPLYHFPQCRETSYQYQRYKLTACVN